MAELTEVRQVDQPGIGPGAVVRSLAGRDAGSRYVVLRQIDEHRVTVCNGSQRPVDSPKHKNRRHLEVLGWVEPALALRLQRGNRVSDNEIIAELDHWKPSVLEEV